MQTITVVPEALLWLAIATAILVAAHVLSGRLGNPYTGEEDEPMQYVTVPQIGVIPVIGEASSAAEIVALLRRAHLDDLAIAEHGLRYDDLYRTVQAVIEDREAA